MESLHLPLAYYGWNGAALLSLFQNPLLWSTGANTIHNIIPDIHFIFSSIIQFKGNGKRYRLGDIYEDDSQCPPVDYKCKRIRVGRKLEWVEIESENSFEGRQIIIKSPTPSLWIFYNIFIFFYLYKKVAPLYRRVVTTALKYLMTIMFSPWKQPSLTASVLVSRFGFRCRVMRL